MTTHSATLRDVQIGDGTSYKFEAEPEGLGLARFASTRLQRQWSDGNQALGADRLVAREVTFAVEVWDGSTFADGGGEAVEALLAPLLAAWGPVRSGVVALTVNIAGTDWVLFGRPVEATVDASGLLYGWARARLVFEATDPRMFSAAESSIVLGLVDGGGRTYPRTYPMTYGSGSDSDGSAVNDGTFETDWTATIVGPVTTPRITLGETGQLVELDGDVPVGSTLVVSSADGSVLLNGSPRPGWPTLLSRFFKLPAGSNTIRFRAASGTGSCTFAWRDAKL